MRNIALIFTFVLALSIQAGAEDVTGISKTKPESGPFVEVKQGFMVPYEITIPGTTAKLKMIPIPGGKFKMGSPESEDGHTPAEGPQIDIEVEPFWMAEHETSWEQYRPYMSLYDIFKTFSREGIRPVTEDNKIDAITAPTPLYEPSFTYEFGEDTELPAITMTNYAARQYTKWLSGVTGSQYRLPSEAEWEYAALGGSDKAYHFGDDAASLGEYAWYGENSDAKPHYVKKKKPNPYGLYDMHGNVWEWVLDQFNEEGYQHLEPGKNYKALASVNWPKEPEPLMVKGGGWDEEAANCRASAKLDSWNDDWKSEDPNVPLSPWWYTSYPSTSVGFRVIRPLNEVPKKEAAKFYQADIEFLNFDIQDRLNEGRGATGIVDKELPAAIKKAE